VPVWRHAGSRPTDAETRSHGPQKIRMTVKYEDYKQFKGESTIKFGDTVEDKKEDKKPDPPKKP
jgi:hypothetical protein